MEETEIIKITDRSIPRWFRELLKQLYPKAKSRDFLFLGHLLFTHYLDEESKQPLIAHEQLALLEGKKEQLLSKNYQGFKYLEDFSNRVQQISWSEWSYVSGRVRSIQVNWPAPIVEALKKLRNEKWHKETRVYISNGRDLNYKNQLKELREEYRQTLIMNASKGVPEAQDLLEYMNNLQPHLFYKLTDNFPHALEVAKGLEKDSNRQVDLLFHIMDQMKPLYKKVNGSTRIFPANESILLLQRDVRAAFTIGWIEMDLKSAQLAICASDWNVRRVIKFLKDGGDIWYELASHFEVELTANTKQTLKIAVYALLFGAGRDKLADKLSEFGTGALEKFLTNPLIKAMYRARTKEFAKIERDGGSFNCFNVWLSKDIYNKRSIIAQRAQAYELKLLYPCLLMAQNDPDFQITLFQHDGFSLNFNNSDFAEPILRAMVTTVQEECRKQGIPTKLERKN